MPSGTGLVGIIGKDGGIEFRDLESGAAAKQFPSAQRRSRRLAAAKDGSLIAGSTRLEGNTRDDPPHRRNCQLLTPVTRPSSGDETRRGAQGNERAAASARSRSQREPVGEPSSPDPPRCR